MKTLWTADERSVTTGYAGLSTSTEIGMRPKMIAWAEKLVKRVTENAID